METGGHDNSLALEADQGAMETCGHDNDLSVEAVQGAITTVSVEPR